VDEDTFMGLSRARPGARTRARPGLRAGALKLANFAGLRAGSIYVSSRARPSARLREAIPVARALRRAPTRAAVFVGYDDARTARGVRFAVVADVARCDVCG